MNLSGAVVLIADGASAIGAATAAAFAAAGARVAVGCERREDVAAERLGDCLIVECDGAPAERSSELVRRTVQHLGGLDVLINGAARDRAVRSDQLRAEDVRDAMEINLIGPMTASREALRTMRRQGRGHIINLTRPSYVLGAPLHAPHAASVAALSSWTRSLQAELDETEIRVTEYFAGAVDGAADEVGATSGGSEVAAAERHLDDRHASGLERLLVAIESPEDIAQQLVACVRRPRGTMYSSAAVRAATAMGLFSRLRVRLGAGAARALRARTGAAVFATSAEPAERVGSVSAAAAPAVAIETPAVDAVAPALETTESAVRAAPRKAAAKKATAAGKKRASRSKEAPADRSSAPAKKTPVRAKKVAPLSPEATARVRAAAERAAASARGKASPAAPPAGEDEES